MIDDFPSNINPTFYDLKNTNIFLNFNFNIIYLLHKTIVKMKKTVFK